MRKSAAIFMIVVLMAVAIVMYMYWQREATTVTKGVLVSSPHVVELKEYEALYKWS